MLGYFSFVRAPGIEPGPNPWQGLVLPLNYARISAKLLYIKKENMKVLLIILFVPLVGLGKCIVRPHKGSLAIFSIA